MKDQLGGKGANLAEMTTLGLPVPPGFTITTDACREYMATGRVPTGLEDEVVRHREHLRPYAVSLTRHPEDADDLCQEPCCAPC